MLRAVSWWLRMLPLRAWDRLLEAWYGFDRSALALLAVPGVVVAVVGTLAHFAYSEHMRSLAEQRRQTDLRCLAENVYYEGRGEPLAGQHAIAEVTLNRVAAPQYPATVCEVVHERRLDVLRGRYVGAFSWTELQMRAPAGPAWQRAMEVAAAVYDAEHSPVVPGALFYHAARIEPRWAKTKEPVTRIGEHIFYR